MNKNILVVLALVFCQGFAQEFDFSSLEAVPNFDASILTGAWDVRDIFGNLNGLDFDDIEFWRYDFGEGFPQSAGMQTYNWYNASTNQATNESLGLWEGETPGEYYYSETDQTDWFRVVNQTEVQTSQGTSQALIAIINRQGVHALVSFTKDLNDTFSLRKFALDKGFTDLRFGDNYFHILLDRTFSKTVMADVEVAMLDGSWRMLCVYDPATLGRLFPWDLAYCAYFDFANVDEARWDLSWDMQSAFGGDFHRGYSLYQHYSQNNTLNGFVGQTETPLALVATGDNGLAVVCTEDLLCFLVTYAGGSRQGGSEGEGGNEDWMFGEDDVALSTEWMEQLNWFKTILQDQLQVSEVKEENLHWLVSGNQCN